MNFFVRKEINSSEVSDKINSTRRSLTGYRVNGTVTIANANLTTFDNCRLAKVEILNSHIDELVFRDSIIETFEHSIKHRALVKNMKFVNCVINRLNLQVGDNSGVIIEFINCFIIDGTFKLSITSEIKLVQSTFRRIGIDGELKNVSLEECWDRGRGSNTNNLVIDGSPLEVKLYLSYCGVVSLSPKSIDQIVINSCGIKGLQTSPMDTSPIKRIRTFEIANSPIARINLSTISIDHLEIIGMGYLYNDDRTFDEIRLCDLEFKHINIIDIEISSLKFIRLRTDGESQLTLKEVLIGSFEVDNCILSGAEFQKVDISEGTTGIWESSLTDVVIHSIKWPKDYKIRPIKNEDPLKTYDDLRESYRQLKVLSNKADNKIDAKFFLSNEIDSYYRYMTIKIFGRASAYKLMWVPLVSLIVPIAYSFSLLMAVTIVFPITLFTKAGTKLHAQYHHLKSKLWDFGDWLILHTNAVFSDFGKSISRPVAYLLLFHLLFITLLLVNKGDELGLVIDFRHGTADAFWKGFSIYVNLLSPVHDSKIPMPFSPEKEISIFGTIDFFMRLSAGYFIYYFLRATRKFNFSV